jgi:hypothetical protein
MILSPADWPDQWKWTEHRWLNKTTGEVQTALDARHDPVEWVTERRTCIKFATAWEELQRDVP